MAEIILFTPREELQAGENLRGFIEVCRTKLTVFGGDLPFDALVWDISAHSSRGANKTAHLLTFSNWSTCSEKVPVPMAEPFGSFAKAYVRYQHAMRPVKAVDNRMMALRVLETALMEMVGSADPVKIDRGVLNRAVQLCKEAYSEGTAYNVANELKFISRFLTENRLVHVATTWSHGLKKNSVHTRVGQEFDERRAAKLPTRRALDALAQIFHIASTPGDVLVSSVTAILCSAPDRISEVLSLPLDCEVRQPNGKDGDVAYGLRWWPGKGAEPMVKWMVPSMVDVVQEAVRRIRILTDAGRQLAKWYEENPGKLYLPEHLKHLRQRAELSMPELGSILFAGDFDATSPLAWVRAHDIPTRRDMGAKSRPNYVKFSDVEKAVLQMLPAGFPVLDAKTGLKYSDALCVVLRNTFNESRATLQCVPEPITYAHIQIRLGNAAYLATSIFETHGLREDDGSQIRISTHQFRHYLNTIAQHGGLSQMDIAKWSGRRDVRQNAAYDHVSAHELVAQLRDTVGDANRIIGPLASISKAVLIPRDEFARLKIPTAHTTELGYCIHDFTMSPCQLHRDCISCEELVCVKGDAEKAARIRQMRDETRHLLTVARHADAAGDMGANRWVAHQQAAFERLDQLCTIFDDPAVPNGAFIQQAQPQPASRLQQAAEARAALLGAENISALPMRLPAIAASSTRRKKS